MSSAEPRPAPLTAVSARRHPLHPAIDEPLIGRLVNGFYDSVRADPVLGPIFEAQITDWQAHLAKMCDFWSSVTMMSGRYKGTPLQAHRALDGLTEAHFARWLGLWRQTVARLSPPGADEVFIDRAERIARSLSIGLFYRPDQDTNNAAAAS